MALYFYESDGLACVQINNKYGFIDKYGKEVIPLKYDYAGSFNERFAPVQVNGKYGFIDINGNIVISSIFRHLLEISRMDLH